MRLVIEMVHPEYDRNGHYFSCARMLNIRVLLHLNLSSTKQYESLFIDTDNLVNFLKDNHSVSSNDYTVIWREYIS